MSRASSRTRGMGGGLDLPFAGFWPAGDGCPVVCRAGWFIVDRVPDDCLQRASSPSQGRGAICRSPCGAVKQYGCRALLSRARVASQPAEVGDGPVAQSELGAMH